MVIIITKNIGKMAIKIIIKNDPLLFNHLMVSVKIHVILVNSLKINHP